MMHLRHSQAAGSVMTREGTEVLWWSKGTTALFSAKRFCQGVLVLHMLEGPVQQVLHKSTSTPKAKTTQWAALN